CIRKLDNKSKNLFLSRLILATDGRVCSSKEQSPSTMLPNWAGVKDEEGRFHIRHCHCPFAAGSGTVGEHVNCDVKGRHNQELLRRARRESLQTRQTILHLSNSGRRGSA